MPLGLVVKPYSWLLLLCLGGWWWNPISGLLLLCLGGWWWNPISGLLFVPLGLAVKPHSLLLVWRSSSVRWLTGGCSQLQDGPLKLQRSMFLVWDLPNLPVCWWWFFLIFRWMCGRCCLFFVRDFLAFRCLSGYLMIPKQAEQRLDWMLSSFFHWIVVGGNIRSFGRKKQTLLRTLDRPRKYENELLPRKKLHVSLVHTASNFQIWPHINTKQQKRHNNRSTPNWYVDMKKRTITIIFSPRFCFHSSFVAFI